MHPNLIVSRNLIIILYLRSDILTLRSLYSYFQISNVYPTCNMYLMLMLVKPDTDFKPKTIRYLKSQHPCFLNPDFTITSLCHIYVYVTTD